MNCFGFFRFFSSQQPDLDRFNVTPRKFWIDYCLHHVTNDFPHYEAVCRQVDSWRLEECDAPGHSSDECNAHGGRGYMRMSQRYIYLTFARYIYQWTEDILKGNVSWKSDEERSRVTKIVTAFEILFEEKRFISFPSAHFLQKRLFSLWKIEGERCISSSFSSLMEAADVEVKKHKTSSQRRMSLQPTLRQLIGKTLSERIQMFPYNEEGVSGRRL